jgi:CheY-like chemotaxis protein
MDGLELLAHVRATSPGTLCVLLSGGGAKLDERLARIVDQLIGKPYSNGALRETVTRMLEGGVAE